MPSQRRPACREHVVQRIPTPDAASRCCSRRPWRSMIATPAAGRGQRDRAVRQAARVEVHRAEPPVHLGRKPGDGCAVGKEEAVRAGADEDAAAAVGQDDGPRLLGDCRPPGVSCKSSPTSVIRPVSGLADIERAVRLRGTVETRPRLPHADRSARPAEQVLRRLEVDAFRRAKRPPHVGEVTVLRGDVFRAARRTSCYPRIGREVAELADGTT